MKFATPAILLGAAALASAQDYNTTGPFYLHITGKENKTIDGYAASFHIGAAEEALALGGVPTNGDVSYEYYLNTTDNEVAGSLAGPLVWNMPYSDGNGGTQYYSQPMQFFPALSSNVFPAVFTGSYGNNFGFDADGKLFVETYMDDTTFTPGTEPTYETNAYQNWYVCWQYYTGYYYYAIASVGPGAPTNPTCEAVDITKEAI